MKIRKTMSIFLCLMMAVSVFVIVDVTMEASAAIIEVPGDYDEIQDAIDNANSGDSIYLKNQIHYPDTAIIVDKTLTIYGESRANTIIWINGSNKGFWVQADYVNISTLTIMNGGFAVYVNDYDNTQITNINIFDTAGTYFKKVTNTTFFNNQQNRTVQSTSGGHASLFIYESDNTNLFASCTFRRLGAAGIYIHKSSPKIMRNYIYGHYGNGINVYHDDAAPFIYENSIYDVRYWGIMNEDSNATIIGNEIYNATEGICLTTQPGTTKGSNCLIENNTIHDIYRYYPHPDPGRSSRVSGIHLGGRSSAVMINNTIYNCTSPYTYKGYGIYVYTLNTPTFICDNNCSYNDYGIVIISSDPNLVMTNNTMIGNAHEGMSIQNLASGVYVGYNYFSNNGEGISSWSSNSQVNNNMILSSTNYGFRIGGSSQVSAKYNVIEVSTYGISLEGSASCSIEKNYINESSSYGIWVTSSSSNSIYDNTIYNNTYGIYLFETSGNTIDENNISENDYGIYMNNSSPAVNYNDIINNDVVGIKSIYYAEPNICNNTIKYNGIGIWNEYYSNGTINNNTVSDNKQAIILFSSSPPITYNNITQNYLGIQCLILWLGPFVNLGPSDPLINWNNLYLNTYCSLYNGDLFTTINAEHNWWGAFTGPGPGDIQGGPVDYIPYEINPILVAGPQ